VSHDAGNLAFCAAHLLNVALTILITLLMYKLLRKLMPAVCGWLSGTTYHGVWNDFSQKQ
jgi:hypothetical protein